ncbi:hypothetical protein B0H17DRAFT_1337811 [Mycena rosella]|uniref:F-box domain-containing protein n=1 Tax=Mycena rosella TaxID=1033263 RepID=A0AAD7G453_MYCRO|nr:hypothetical protein B0H17DRAFT_1337811 [Mycena rosella]
MNAPARKKRKINPGPEKHSIVAGGKRGCLSWVLTMPLDIIFEIFGHLNPLDLIVLARMTKTLRCTLMHKSAISVWRSALSNVPGLPDKPPDMSEPAWANLVFDRHCHYCGAKGVRKIHWRPRLRLCHPCTRKHIVRLKSRGANAFRDLSWKQTSHAIVLLVTLIPAQFTGTHFIYLQDMYEHAMRALAKTPPEDRETFISDTQAKMVKIDQHAALCEVWAKIQSENLVEELTEHRVTRLQQIKHKLEALGYDIDAMPPHEIRAFEQVAFVKQNQPLTPRVWNRIKKPLLQYLDARSKRAKLKRVPAIEHPVISLDRKRLALAVMRRFWDSKVLDSDSLPVNHAEASSAIHDIIQSPESFELDEESVGDRTGYIMYGLFDEWRATLGDRLLDQMARAAQASDTFVFKDTPWKTSEPAQEELERRLSLATTVFTCECSEVDFTTVRGVQGWVPLRSGPPTIKPLFYPNQVLGHICLPRTPQIETHWTVTSILLDTFRASRGYPGPQVWDCGTLGLNHALGEMAQRLVRLTPLDPETATVLDMDRLGVHFACLGCSVQDKKEIEVYRTRAFDWREAIRHEHTTHASTPCHWQLLTANELEEGRQDGEEGWPAEFRLDEELPEEPQIWLCMICTNVLPAVMDRCQIRRHLQDGHGISEPVCNRDYYKDFSAPTCGYEHKLPHGVRVRLLYAMRNLRRV